MEFTYGIVVYYVDVVDYICTAVVFVCCRPPPKVKKWALK